MENTLFHYGALILAAGASKRMGDLGPKGLLKWENRPLISHHLQVLAQAGLQEKNVVVVLGYHQELFLPVLGDSRYVINSRPERGQFSSLQCGLSALLEETENACKGIFVFPVDMPFPQTSLLQEMIKFCQKVVIPRYKGKGGHPILLQDKDLLKSLREIAVESDQARLDVQVKKLRDSDIYYHEVEDERVCLNFNTPEKWNEYQKLYSR